MNHNSDLMRHFMLKKPDISPRLAWNATTNEQHAAWRRRFSARLRRLLGRQPERAPLRVDWAEKFCAEKFTRHKIYVRSEKDYWIPAYYFVPRNIRSPAPAVVCLHGHSGIYPYIREGNRRQRKAGRDDALDYAPFLAEHGYATLAPVQRGWDETAASIAGREKGCHRMVQNSFLAGMTPVGLRAWDASRLIDFLETQETVDRTRVGVAGLSGGGMVALFWAALERRVGLAMIAGYFCTFKDSIYSIPHCLCNCIPHMLEWGEMKDVGALIAPRPLLIISGKKDPIFPITATRKAYRELKEVYRLLQASKNLESDFFDGSHAWSNRKTLGFLKKHFGTP